MSPSKKPSPPSAGAADDSASLTSSKKSPTHGQRELILKWEERLTEWEAMLQEEKARLRKEKEELEERQRSFQEKEKTLLDLKSRYERELERVSRLTRDEAERQLLAELEKELKGEIAKRIRKADDEVKRRADEKAKEILIDAMRQGVTDYVSEYTISEVKLPDSDLKGRVIGREGRNIRALENLTGVDVEIDEDEPIIRLSSFDPIRREIARRALMRLIKDRRIQPSRIEEVVELTRGELDKIIWKAGEDLCHKLGVYNLADDKIKLLGRFKFRFSYGQNLISHTLEETKIGIALAHELGADVETVKLGCLLHDIGKVVTDREGTHVEKGVELLKRNRMPQAVIDCVAQHHEDQPLTSLEAAIVYLADAISGSRPGARYEAYEEYVKRIDALEETAAAFEGVEEAYAIQAGRELRVIVKAESVDDDGITVLARDIKNAIEKSQIGVPGNVKVTVIREIRASAVAQT
jgi:ribonuclease Y